MINYLWFLQNLVQTCDNLIAVGREFYKDGTGRFRDIHEHVKQYWFCYNPKYQEYFDVIRRVIEICDMLGIEAFDKNKNNLLKHINLLSNPEYLKKIGQFSHSVEEIKLIFNITKGELEKKIDFLDDEEKKRLNEAFHCFVEGCYYSCIAMSVSSIEFRLLDLMSKANTEKTIELKKLTLGQLVQEYLNNKKNYKEFIPKKYEALLMLVNEYRIFSVHPKKEKVSKNSASSILNLTCEFLFDERLKSSGMKQNS